MKKILLALVLGVLCLSSMAKSEDKEVHGEFVYYLTGDENKTIKQIKDYVLGQARLNALANTFGINMAQTIAMSTEDNGNDVKSEYKEYTNEMVKGRWIRDRREAVMTMGLAENGKIFFKYEVWGIGREVKTSDIDLKWDIYVGTPNANYRGTTFNSEQRLFVQFRSPVDGYVLVYLLDNSAKEAFCCLPYRQDKDGVFDVKGKRDYVFFDHDGNPELYPGNLKMSAQEGIEENTVYLLFSPNRLTKMSLEEGGTGRPDFTTEENFNRWLEKVRAQDDHLVVKQQTIRIKAPGVR